MSKILGYDNWRNLNEAGPGFKIYYVAGRENYIYRRAGKNSSGDINWQYQEKDTDDKEVWHKVTNSSTLKKLNSQYQKNLASSSGTSAKTVAKKSKIPDLKYGAANISSERQAVAKQIVKTGKKLGWTDNAIACMVGEVGRENAWRKDVILKGHKDPANNKSNVGIISWQGNRKKNLLNFLKEKGSYDGKNLSYDLSTIGHMVEFFEKEMDSQGGDSSILKKPGATTKQISDQLYKSIRYSLSPKYNTPDAYFKVKKNHEWAQRARDLGIVSYA